MGDKNIRQELRLNNIVTQDVISLKIEDCKILNDIEPFLILASMVTECVSISAFASLIVIPVGIASSAVRIKLCAITAVIEMYKSIMKKKKKKFDKIVVLAKTKLLIIEVLNLRI